MTIIQLVMATDPRPTAAFLLCARDCARYLPRALEQIRRVGALFSNYRVWFYENDSVDDTGELLEAAALKDSRIRVIRTSLQGPAYRFRTWRIAHARQSLLDALRESSQDPSYVIVMDADDVAAYDPAAGARFINAALARADEWDACFPPLSYDLWAYRAPGLTRNHLELRVAESVGVVPRRTEELYKKKLQSAAARFGPTGLQRVHSAFNGIGIYRYDIYKKGKYSGSNPTGRLLSTQGRAFARQRLSLISRLEPEIGRVAETRLAEDCEHVAFNISLTPARLRCLAGSAYPGRGYRHTG